MQTATIIIEMAMQRVRPAMISHELGVPIDRVYATIYRARQGGADIPPFDTGPIDSDTTRAAQELRFHLSPDAGARLAEEARKRGMPPSRLARELITAICDDTMFAAILED